MKKITRTAAMAGALILAAGTSVSSVAGEAAQAAKVTQATRTALRASYHSWLMDKIKEIISEHLNISVFDIWPEDMITRDLGGDSLDVIEIVMMCEEVFDIEISDYDIEKAGGPEAMTVIGLHDAILYKLN